MKRFASLTALFLLVFAGIAAGTARAPMTRVVGRVLEIRKGTLFIETAPRVRLRIKLNSKTVFVSGSGSPFFRSWLFPGDGVIATLGKDGRVVKIEVHVSWFFGSVAFVSPGRITLLEGEQFFFDSHSPIYLNGTAVNGESMLRRGQTVVIRFDPLHQAVCGIWAFDFSKPAGPARDIFRARSAVLDADPAKPLLEINAVARANGVLSAELLGVSGFFSFEEKKPGEYTAHVPLPRNIVLQGSYLRLEWRPAPGRHDGDEERIVKVPVSIFTEPPAILDAQPANGSRIAVNPPLIFVTLDPEGTPLAPDSIRFFLDGRDITHRCYRSTDLLFYSPPRPLEPGKHWCVIKGKSSDGGYPFRKRWCFTVKRGPGPALEPMTKRTLSRRGVSHELRNLSKNHH